MFPFPTKDLFQTILTSLTFPMLSSSLLLPSKWSNLSHFTEKMQVILGVFHNFSFFLEAKWKALPSTTSALDLILFQGSLVHRLFFVFPETSTYHASLSPIFETSPFSLILPHQYLSSLKSLSGWCKSNCSFALRKCAVWYGTHS